MHVYLYASENRHCYMTRQADELRPMHIRTEIERRQLACSGIQFYNKVRKTQIKRKITFRTALIDCLRDEVALVCVTGSIECRCRGVICVCEERVAV